jgi:hypothetical protein
MILCYTCYSASAVPRSSSPQEMRTRHDLHRLVLCVGVHFQCATVMWADRVCPSQRCLPALGWVNRSVSSNFSWIYISDIPHGGSDFGEYSSIKPGIPITQALEQVQVLLSEVEDDIGLTRNIQDMNANKVVEYPPRSGVLNAFAFLVWKGGRMLLEGGANPILQGRIHQQADRHHHQQYHDAFGLFEIERGGQKLGGFQKAKAAFRLGLAFIGP